MRFRILLLGLTLVISSQAFSIEAVNHYELAVRAQSTGKNDEAYIHLKNATQLNPSHIPSKLLLGKVFFEVGNIQAAGKELLEAYQLGADINLVLPLLGSSLILQKKIEELLQLEDKYYLLDRENKFEWHLLRGQAYLINSDPDLADFEFKEAINLFPNDVRAMNTLGSLYVQLQILPKAAELIKKSLLINENNEKTWQLQGELQLAQGNQDAALISFQEGHRIAPDDPKILRNLTSLYLSKNNFTLANIYNEKIIEQSPEDPTANLIKAWFMKNQGNEAEADALLNSLSQKISLIDPNNTEAIGSSNFIQGVAEYMLGNFEVAQNALLKHIERSNQDTKSIKILAEIYLKSKQIDEALKLLESHQRVVTENFELGSLLINIYIYKDNIFRAEKTFHLLDERFPNSSYLSVLRAKIYDLQDNSALALATLNGLNFKTKNLQYSLLKAKLLIQTSKLKQAQDIAEELYITEKNNIDVLNLLAGVWVAQEQYAKAQKLINQVLDLAPNNTTAHYNAALILIKRNDFKGARAILVDSVGQSPSHAPSLLKLADIDSKSNNIATAENWLVKLLAYNPSHKAANQRLFDIYISQNRWKDALRINTLLLVNDRLNAPLLLQKALIHHEMREQDTSIKHFNLVYELWLDEPEKLQILANYQFKSDDVAGAEISLLKAIKNDESNESLQIDLANLKLSLKQYEDVIKIINILKRKKNNSEPFLILQGRLEKAMGNNETSSAFFAKALDLYPKSQQAILAAYSLAQDNITPNLFINHVEKLLALEPNLHWIRKLLADLQLDSLNWAEAEKHYQYLLNTEQYALAPAILNNLANIYAKTDLTKASQAAKAAIDNGGDKNAATLDTMGWILAKQNNYSEALNYLREAYSLDSKNSETRYHLGYVLFHLDRPEEALDQLQAAVKNNNFPEYEDAVILLNNLK